MNDMYFLAFMIQFLAVYVVIWELIRRISKLEKKLGINQQPTGRD